MQHALSQYAGKTVFITGHTGFKGTWLTYLLTLLGGKVVGYSLPASNTEFHPRHFDQLGLQQSITHLEGDICDHTKLAGALFSSKPDYVFHLAAQALVKQSYLDPLETFNTNVMGTANLLQAAKMTPSVKSLICVTSDKCYENHEWLWGYRESDQLGGHDPYSASKAAAELIFSAFWRSFLHEIDGMGAATVRAGNVIGGGDWSVDRIIPDCIRAIEAEKPIILRNPNATRPWQHVLEPLSGYLLLGAQIYDDPLNFNGAWNFGPSVEEHKTVGEIVDNIVGQFGYGNVIKNEVDSSQHEAQLLQLNCDKANLKLNWKPRWDIETTLLKTAEWYKEALNGTAVEAITKQQIKEYFLNII